tara:strand:+ start:414 stop:1565 length:1152 start_codon:yes stop_codon:yes gene_type:complete
MNKILLIISYFIIFFNFNLSGKESSETLKVGVLAPLSGEYKELGNSLLYSLQLALEEINDKKVFIVPRDTGYKNSDKLNDAIKDFKSQGIKIVIGPISYEDFNEVKQYSGITFISPSNITPEFSSNIISIGISLESQMSALIKFLKKKKKSKTVIMIPQNNYTNLVEQKLKKLDLNNFKIFKYNPNPEVLTGEIEILTNYSQRKKNLELRKKMFQDKEDEQSIKELERLDQLYTLGGVNFDSVIIIDFGNNLKSVLTSLVYTDVSQTNVLFTTVNQWFDESIFFENTIRNIYYPSINYKEFKKYNKLYFNKFKSYPNEITILTYDALGLIYYAWKKNGTINSVNNFSFKNKIKGKIGTFYFNNKKVTQELNIYKTEDKKFTKF